MSFSRPIQWYHSPADPIWPDGTFKDRKSTIINKNVVTNNNMGIKNALVDASCNKRSYKRYSIDKELSEF